MMGSFQAGPRVCVYVCVCVCSCQVEADDIDSSDIELNRYIPKYVLEYCIHTAMAQGGVVQQKVGVQAFYVIDFSDFCGTNVTDGRYQRESSVRDGSQVVEWRWNV